MLTNSRQSVLNRVVLLTLCIVIPGAASSYGSVAQELEHIRNTHNIPVLAYAVLDDNEWHLNVLGAAIDTPLRWGSITKSVTALLVHRLAAAELVSLDEPLQRYVDDGAWKNAWRADNPVTVRQLLESKAGLPDLSGKEFAHNVPVSLQDALALNPAHRSTRWPPALQHVYSNMSAGLTQLLIETVSRQSYCSAARQYVFAPLGMASATCGPLKTLPGGFKADGVTPIPYWHMTFAAYGAMNANLEDLTRLVAALRAEAGVLAQPRAGVVNTLGFKFDYASGVYPRIRQGHVWYSHGGDADGYRSRYAFLARHPRAYIASINTDNPIALGAVERTLERHLTADLPVPVAPAEFNTTAAEHADMAGRYYPSGVRFGLRRWKDLQSTALTVNARSGEGLSVVKKQHRTNLIPVSPGQFRRSGDPVATIALMRINLNGASVRILQGALGNYIHANDCNSHLASFFPPCKQP